MALYGMDPSVSYTVCLDVNSSDIFFYKYLNNEWTVVSDFESTPAKKKLEITHCSSPNKGEYWMADPVTFHSKKISLSHAELHSEASISIF